MDKVFLHLISFKDDKNHQNHAYTEGKSCLTAVLQVQKFLKKCRDISKLDKNHLYIPVGCAEDISAAFESVSEHSIRKVTQLLFKNEKVKIADIVSSYLDRESMVFDQRNPDTRLPD